MTKARAYDHIFLEQSPIQVDRLQRMLMEDEESKRYGAVVSFWGTVREEDGNCDPPNSIVGIEYETYSQLYLGEVERIIAEIRAHFGESIGTILFVHRMDAVPVGDITSCAIVAASHRREALLAIEMLTDSVKERVPIWKKLIKADGTRCEVRMHCGSRGFERE